MQRVLILVGLSLCAGAYCSAGYPTAPGTPPQVVALQIQYPLPTPDPRVGRSISLDAYSVDSDGVWTDVTRQTAWYASDSSIVRASSGSGTLLAVGAGVTSIIASHGGLTDSIPITVRPESPSYPRLEFTNLSTGAVTVGGTGGATLTRQQTLTTASMFVTGQAVWTSSNPAVATASIINSAAAGFKGVATGTTRITASIDGQSLSLGFSVAPRR